MGVLLLETDLKWLKEVHHVPEETKFAILYGNEDAPNRIECWFVPDPEFDQIPDYVYEEKLT